MVQMLDAGLIVDTIRQFHVLPWHGVPGWLHEAVFAAATNAVFCCQTAKTQGVSCDQQARQAGHLPHRSRIEGSFGKAPCGSTWYQYATEAKSSVSGSYFPSGYHPRAWMVTFRS